MNDDGVDQGQPSAGALPNLAETPPIDDSMRILASRRLAQITEVLGLDAAHFERARNDAKAALDGAHDRILAAQSDRVLSALAEVGDPLARARVVDLMTWLAQDKPD